MSKTKTKRYSLFRRFYVEATWEVSALTIEDALELLKQTKPGDVLSVDGAVNDWGVEPGHDGVRESC